MDQIGIDQHRLIAGRHFIEALDALGLHSTMASWVYSRVSSQFLLVIVTDFFDLKGPLEVNRYMLAAYNASALPQEIDPFNVQFCSPEQVVARQLFQIANLKASGSAGTGGEQPLVDDVETHKSWILRNKYYQTKDSERPPQAKSADLARKWQLFIANVDKLAA